MQIFQKLLLFCGATALVWQLPAAEMTFQKDGSSLTLDPEAGRLIRMQTANAPVAFRGDHESELWTLSIFDAEALEKNTQEEHNSIGYYWQSAWVPGTKFYKASEAQVRSLDFNQESGVLRIEYQHAAADVTMSFTVNGSGITWQGAFLNRGTDAISDFSICNKLQFQMTEKDSVIVPDFTNSGIEYSTVRYLPWAMCDAWDGFLVKTPQGYSSIYAIQSNPEKQYYPAESFLRGVSEDGKSVAFSNSTILMAAPGERRDSIVMCYRAFDSLRSFADAYVADNHLGEKTLRQKYSPEIFDRLAHAYLAPAGGDMKALTELIQEVPGTFLLHTPSYMHPPEGSTENWDAFPNYFPPVESNGGTMEDYEKLIRTAIDHGNLFMPRNSFFYWVDKSDVDLELGLRNLAMRRIDGKVRVAAWALPGYLVSPSSKKVLAKLEEFFQQWVSMGANVYFTNVISAIGPYGNRYDLHPDSAAPDSFYHAIFQMMKKHGDRIPLLTEGGGAWQMAYQAGFTTHPDWDPAQPVAAWRITPDRGTFAAARPEIGTFLFHEYVQSYPHNAGIAFCTDAIAKLTFSAVNGFQLKFGLTTRDQMNNRNKLWLRTIATLSEEIWSELYGERLLRYEESADQVITAEYQNAVATGNYSSEPKAFQCALGSGMVAPDGFAVVTKDGNRLAGFFTELFGATFPQGELIVLVYQEDHKAAKLYLPLSRRTLTVQIPVPGSSKQIAVVAEPAPPAVAHELPCYAVDLQNATAQAEHFAVADAEFPDVPGNDEIGAIPAWSFPGTDMREIFEYRHDSALPENSRLVHGKQSANGLVLERHGGKLEIEDEALQLDQQVYIEMIFKYDTLPAFGNGNGESYLLLPETATRTVELRYNVYNDAIRFLIPLENGGLADVICQGVPIEAGKYYHVIAWYDGHKQQLEVNGKRVSRPLSGAMIPTAKKWQAGDFSELEVALLRIGGANQSDRQEIQSVEPTAGEGMNCSWSYSGDSSVPAEVRDGNALHFTPAASKYTWQYLLADCGSFFAEHADVTNLEFTLDAEIPEGMMLFSALQTNDGGVYSSEYFPAVHGKVANLTARVPLKTYYKASYAAPGSAEDLKVGEIRYIYLGAVGSAAEVVPGNVVLKRVLPVR